MSLMTARKGAAAFLTLASWMICFGSLARRKAGSGAKRSHFRPEI
jgi:hypothetical protein